MISIMMLLIAAPALAMQQARVQCGRTATTRVPPIVMLRNIDSCEAVILTLDVAMDAATGHTRRGVERLIGECKKEGALVALLVPGDGASPSPSDDVLRTMAAHGTMCWPFKGTEPQTSELSELRRALKVEEPEGFGGSDGFGQAPGMAYGREPIAARCVVLVTSLAETAAAIGAGMRTVGLPATEGDWVDEALDGVADVCLDAVGEDGDTWALRLDDLSTPGSYWLNPAMPRDLEGNSVDPETGVPYSSRAAAEEAVPTAAAAGGVDAVEDEDDEDAAVRAMLQDVESRPRPPSSPPTPTPPPPPLPPPPLLPSPYLNAAAASSHRRCPSPRAALEVSPAEAAALADRGDATLIDVRQPGEYRLDGHVDGSSNIAAFTWEHGFHLPNELFAEEVAAAHDTAETLILLCADGRLSQGAAAVLEAAAFSQVLSLAGGLRAWEADAEDEGSGVPPLVVDEDGEGGLTSAWV